VRTPRKGRLTAAQISARTEDIRRAYFTVFGTDEGRLVLGDLEERCFMHKGTLSLARGGFDGLMTAWCEGRRSVVLDIHDIIRRARAGQEPDQDTTAKTEDEEKHG